MNVNNYIELKFMALKELTLQHYVIIKDRQYVLFKLTQEEYLVLILHFLGTARVQTYLIKLMSLLFFLFKINALLKSLREMANVQIAIVQIILCLVMAISIFIMIVT